MILVLLVLMAAATLQDLLRHEVSDLLSLAIALTGLCGLISGSWELHWIAAVLGPLVGLVLTGPFFHFGVLGGGDVKLVTALGIWFGPVALAWILLLTAIFGGLLAGIAAVRGKSDMAYVPAIAAGVLLHICFPTLLLDLMNLPP